MEIPTCFAAIGRVVRGGVLFMLARRCRYRVAGEAMDHAYPGLGAEVEPRETCPARNTSHDANTKGNVD